MPALIRKPSKTTLDTRPLYVRVEEVLSESIKAYSPGEKIPPEAELAQQLGVSRSTLREVLRTFEERGVITSKHGIGTFIRENVPQMESGLEVLESLDTLAGKSGIQVSMKNLKIHILPADRIISEKLQIPEGEDTIAITRARVTGDHILAYMYDVIPASLTSVDELMKYFTGSVIDFLKKNTAVNLSWALDNLYAVLAEGEVARQMEIPRGTALLLMEEQVYSAENTVINYSRNYYVTSHFLFHIVRRSL